LDGKRAPQPVPEAASLEAQTRAAGDGETPCLQELPAVCKTFAHWYRWSASSVLRSHPKKHLSK